MSLKVNRYNLLAHVYFFFNAVGLPFGLLYTTILSPFLYLWLLLKKRKPLLLPFLAFLLPFDLIHLFLGVDLQSFIISNLMLLATYIVTISFHYFIEHYPRLSRIFRQILVLNIVLTLVALAILFTPYRELLWYVKQFTKSVDSLPRLALMTYEASYYSLLFSPIAFYYLLKVFFRHNYSRSIFILALVLIPLALSMSVGVLGAMILAFIGMYIIHRDKIATSRIFFYPMFISVLLLVTSIIALWIFFPDNPLFIRLGNIFSGEDTSAAGRTTDSFTMGYRVAKEKSLLFGAGLGQIKILAPEIVGKYYQYWGKLEVVRIPNTIGETLAIFGFAGLFLRFMVIAWFYFKTRPFENYYRTLLFIFIFIYQFTGSFITNIAEYVIWALAFSNVFPQFNVKKQ